MPASGTSLPPLPKEAPVGIVGAGAMGAGIAQVAAAAGHLVRLHDARPDAVAHARAQMEKAFERQVARGRMRAEAAEATLARVRPAEGLGALADCALVVEAIVEDLAAKRSLLGDLARVVEPGGILASNTSSLSITALAAGLPHPGRVVGMHFFNPAPVMALVEVVSGLATDPAVAGRVFATAAAWGKSPVHARSTPGFIVNRVARPYYGEGLRLLAEGAADVATLDALMREAGGFRMGPFELMDLIGLDVNFAATRSVWEACFDDPRYQPSLVQQEMVAAGRLGRKSGRGFYDHGAGAVPPAPATLAGAPRPARVSLAGEPGIAAPLVERIAAGGVAIDRAPPDPAWPDGCLRAGGTTLALTDGRTATRRAAEAGTREIVLFDLAHDYRAATRLGIAAADTCSEAGLAAAVGTLQAAGLALSRLDDAPGLAVMRTVCLLANEASEAVAHRVGTPAGVDLAMRQGVNYPSGPLEWAGRIGLGRVADVVRHLAQHYGEDRYRLSPLLARKVWAGRSFD